jgi:hypothetical protein
LSSARISGRGLALVALLVLAAIGVWLLPRNPDTPEVAETPVAESSPPPAPSAPPPAPRPKPMVAPAPPVEVADDGLPFMPPGPNDPRPDGPVHPHPITPEHERIFAENRLVGALNGAMDVKDVAGMRRLLKQYEEAYPEDAHDLHVGYEVIADCLEHPGATTRAAAVRFGEAHRGSTLRRFVNRHCLEPPQ